MAKVEKITLQIAGRDVDISSPSKVYFPKLGVTKLQLVQYYLDVGEAALLALRGRPMILKRFVGGADSEPFFQKRAPEKRPDWIETARFEYPSGGVADEVVVNDLAQLAWTVNLGCIEMHAHPIRGDDMDHPDELRIDLDPTAGSTWQDVVEVARVAHAVLDDFGLTGWPKTSGNRGAHIWVRIQRKWPFTEVRKAALAFAREVERRAPGLATSTWDKTERKGVLIDYNQNARDRTTAAAYSARATADARVSMPLTWAELDQCEPADFTIANVPKRVREKGDAHAKIDDKPLSIEKLLALAETQAPRKNKKGPRALRKSDGTEFEESAASAADVENAKPDASDAAAGAPSAASAPLRNARILVVARSKSKADALAGLERWKTKHAEVAALLSPEDVIVDAMRGRSSAWYRIRINLKNVPAQKRPAPATPDPDYDPKLEIPPEWR